MKKIIPAIAILISVCFLVLTYANKPFNNSNIQILSHNNNYAEDYANKNSFTYKNISDSELTNLENNSTSDFNYNTDNENIEITNYNGTDENIIIPEEINGYPVTTISMNLTKIPKTIYLPATVTKINSIIDNNLNNNFYLTIIIEIVALIITLISILIINKKSNKEKTIYITFLYILSIIYLLGISTLSYINFDNLLLISIIITIIYLIIFIPLYYAKNKLYKYDKNINNIDTFIKKALNIANKINNQDLIETIKYSDPISNNYTSKIEQEILDKLSKTLNSNSKENIEEIISLIKERNDICKKTKGK